MWKITARLAAIVTLGVLAAWMFAERGRPVRRSTWRMLKKGDWQGWRGRSFLHGYLYARFPKQYIGHSLKHLLPGFDPRRRQSVADHYHGKVLPTELAKALITVDRPIDVPDLEQIIPYPVARRLVLEGPPEVVAFECPCRLRKPDHCEPTQVCMIVGQPFVDFILQHHPSQSKRLTTGEAVALLEAEHARGHLHAAYFKDVMLNRFYAICNCCECCCGAMQAQRNGVPMLISSGFVAQVSEDDCQGCGECEEACPFSAISVNGISQVDYEACMGCGVCVSRCEWSAIELVSAPDKGLPLDIPTLMEQAIRAG